MHKLSKIRALGCSMICLLVTTSAGAQDGQAQNDEQPAIRTLGTTITGNQEQPKVLYIVPWKAAFKDAGLPYRPISAQTEAVFRHVEPQEHQRHLEFLQELHSNAD